MSPERFEEEWSNTEQHQADQKVPRWCGLATVGSPDK
jgi:hypothetical protein